MIWSDVISPDSIPSGSLQSKSKKERKGTEQETVAEKRENKQTRHLVEV